MIFSNNSRGVNKWNEKLKSFKGARFLGGCEILKKVNETLFDKPFFIHSNSTPFFYRSIHSSGF